MENQTKLAFRILAALYPDSKPSEVRAIINQALEREVNEDDIELWMVMAKEKPEKEPEKKIIEEHHYYHHGYPWYTSITTSGSSINLCDNSNASTISISPLSSSYIEQG